MGSMHKAREAVVSATMHYLAAERGDVQSPYYDAELEMREEALEDAVREYAEIVSPKKEEELGGVRITLKEVSYMRHLILATFQIPERGDAFQLRHQIGSAFRLQVAGK